MPAQLRRGYGQGHRHGWARRELAGGGWGSGREIRAEGRSADHDGDHREGARGVRAVLPVLSRERELSRAHLRFCGTPGNREDSQGNSVRGGAGKTAFARTAATLEGFSQGRVAGTGYTSPSDTVRANYTHG